MIEKLESPQTIKETEQTVNSAVTSYIYPIDMNTSRRRPIPVFPNYVNAGEVFTNANKDLLVDMDGSTGRANWRNYFKARNIMLQESVYNDWNTEWRHMELHYAVKTDMVICSWCKSEDAPILKKEIIVREQKTSNTFNSLHKHCALEKLIKLKGEIGIGVERLEDMIDKTEGMRKGKVGIY